MEAIETRETTETPVRYKAFDNPGILWVYPDKTLRERATDGQGGWGGFEFAVYSHKVTNTMYPHLEDGIYASIVSYQGKAYCLNCCSTRPNVSRTQFSAGGRYGDYATAMQALKVYILQAYTFCNLAPLKISGE